MRHRFPSSPRVAALALSAACAAPEPAPPAPTPALSPDTPVVVTGEQIRGAVSDDPDVMTFKGIPFAAPPVGDLRWRPPQHVADEALAHYAVTAPEAAKPGLDHLFHDMWIAGPVRTLAAHHASTSSAWLYHFTLVPPTDMGATLGSHHAGEIAYVFGNLVDRGGQTEDRPASPLSVGDWSDLDRRVSAAMIGYWVQFAATGNPNRDGLTSWPELDAADRHRTFGDALEVGTGLHAAGVELFEAHESARREEAAWGLGRSPI